MKKLFIVFAVLLVAFGVSVLYAQQGILQTQYGVRDAYGRAVVAGDFISFSPTQLGASAITLPASGFSAFTNTVDTRGVKRATLFFNCTQAVTVVANLYAEDGTTVALQQNLLATAPSGQQILYWGSESNPTNTGGTAGAFRFPQRAMAFQWSNTTASAGTCTARLFLAY